jgi:uncharacterized protein YecE (DUF72 family)
MGGIHPDPAQALEANGELPARDLPEARIGCAGWSIPAAHAGLFAGTGTHLQRYARRFNCVEINSSFYRPHRPETYARWSASVPASFQFAVKAPREITHVLRLIGCEAQIAAFLDQVRLLGANLGPILVQLPPSLAFDSAAAGEFFRALRDRFGGAVVCEPRHPTWFEDPAAETLSRYRVARAAAEPAVVPAAARPGGWRGVTYYRLHGSPRIYYSAYSEDALERLAVDVRTACKTGPAWCIFDNTAEGSATTNALALGALVAEPVS